MSQEDGLTDWAARAKVARYRAGELAKVFSVSEVTLRRRFRSRFGRDLRVWLQDLRLQRFKVLVTERKSLKEIAAILGLKHESYLSWLFARAVGVSMREYRSAQRAGGEFPALRWSDSDESHVLGTGVALASSSHVIKRFAMFTEPARRNPLRVRLEQRL